MKTHSITTWLLLFIKIFFVMGMSSIALASSNIEQGDIAFANRDITKAIQQYQIELKNTPDSVLARTKLAQCYIRKGYKSATSKLINEALNLDSNNIDALLLRSKLYIWDGQLDEATKLLNQVLTLSPDNIEAYSDLAGIYNNQGDTEAADALYLKIDKLTTNN